MIVVQSSTNRTSLNPDLLSVEQDGVKDHCSDRGESESIRQ
jgi:hypothetical protein